MAEYSAERREVSRGKRGAEKAERHTRDAFGDPGHRDGVVNVCGSCRDDPLYEGWQRDPCHRRAVGRGGPKPEMSKRVLDHRRLANIREGRHSSSAARMPESIRL